VVVRVQPLEPEPLAWRYLWHTLAAGDVMWIQPDLGAAAEALVAAGLIANDDPQLAEIAAVSERMGFRGRALRHQGVARASSDVREPWRSLLATHGHSGVDATLPVGAVTPVFDGVSVGVPLVELGASGFEARVEVAPGAAAGHHFGRAEPLVGIAWWAADDRGKHYLGHLNSWSANDERGSGSVEFSVPLDPRARRLDLIPTTLNARAVISVPIPAGLDAAS
jgi:hypothetical protein